jgi:hypothetical protein
MSSSSGFVKSLKSPPEVGGWVQIQPARRKSETFEGLRLLVPYAGSELSANSHLWDFGFLRQSPSYCFCQLLLRTAPRPPESSSSWRTGLARRCS